MGVTTIRTSNNADKLCKEFYAYNDNHTSALMGGLTVTRWVAIRLGNKK
jgi:hypothetical protein